MFMTKSIISFPASDGITSLQYLERFCSGYLDSKIQPWCSLWNEPIYCVMSACLHKFDMEVPLIIMHKLYEAQSMSYTANNRIVSALHEVLSY